MSKHRHLSILLAPVLALLALLLLLLGMASAAGITANEAALNPDGLAYEINADSHGDLWISDYSASEIWQVHPPTGAYTIYQGMSNASDARADAMGGVWWTDTGLEGKLGRISIAAGTVTTWALPGAGQVWGIAIDAGGRVWTTDAANSQVYGFAPDTGELCTYPMPDAGTSDYLLARGGELWLGDNTNARIVKLDPAANQFTTWQLPVDAYPEGMALAGNGDLWWADASRAELARLEPGSSIVTAYALPAGTWPEMIALDRGQAWYTDGGGTLGMLDPARATGTSSVATRTTAIVTPDCRDLGAGITSAVTVRTGTLAWSPHTYGDAPSVSGGKAYQLPTGASPWGITVSAEELWVVDQGRQQLLRLPLITQITHSVYLPYVSRH